MAAEWVLGIDGCRGGWVGVYRDLAGTRFRLHTAADIRTLFRGEDALRFAAVDMPMGLPTHIDAGGRAPERLLRPLLGARRSSLFAVPSRAAVFEVDYAAACAAAQASSTPPRRISKQCFHLFPKIREVDALLQAEPHWREIVRETHPEAAFMTMNGGKPLRHPKKINGRPCEDGLAERRALLLECGGFPGDFLHRPARAPFGVDDLLDACACTVTALRLSRNEAVSYPSPPQRDALGLPIAIWT